MTAPQFGEHAARLLSRLNNWSARRKLRMIKAPFISQDEIYLAVIPALNALAGIAHPERLGDLLAASQRVRLAFKDWCDNEGLSTGVALNRLEDATETMVAVLAALTDDAEVGR